MCQQSRFVLPFLFDNIFILQLYQVCALFTINEYKKNKYDVPRKLRGRHVNRKSRPKSGGPDDGRVNRSKELFRDTRVSWILGVFLIYPPQACRQRALISCFITDLYKRIWCTNTWISSPGYHFLAFNPDLLYALA